jgi:ubiquinone/menaquinone biosynthesis C-methylase UbiE
MKILKIIASILKRIFYLNNLKIIKTNTWQSKKVVEKFYKINNLDNKDIFHEVHSKLFSNYITNNEKVLDVGCGTGRLLNILRKYSINCYGLDVSQEMVNKIENKKNVYIGSVFDIPFDNNFFDIVTSMDLMVHFDETEKILKEKLKVTKKQGLVIFNIGSEEHYTLSKNILKNEFNPIYENFKTTIYKPYYKTILDDDLVNLGKKIGFSLVKSVPYNFFSGNNFFRPNISENFDLSSKFNSYFKNKLFRDFIIELENKVINSREVALTFYKIVVLRKNLFI